MKHQVATDTESQKNNEPSRGHFVQQVSVQGEIITNQNSYEIEEGSIKVEQPTLISHQVVRQEGKLIRITRVQIGSKIVTIRDSYEGSVPLQCETSVVYQEKKSSSNEETRVLFQEHNPINCCQAHHKHDRQYNQNRSKTIYKLFKKWLKNQNPPLKEVLASLNELLTRHRRYNTRLFRRLSKHKQLRKTFILFCRNEGKSLILEQRFMNRDAHLKTLKKFLGICQDQIYWEELEQKQHLWNSKLQ